MNRHPQSDFSVRVKTKLLSHPKTRSVAAMARALGFARNTVSIAINHPTMLPTVKVEVIKYLKIAA